MNRVVKLLYAMVALLAVTAGIAVVSRGGGDPAGLVISEIMYHPRDESDGGPGPDAEFVEIANVGGVSADLGGHCITSRDGAGRGCFSDGTTLDPGGFAVMARDPELFAEVYGFAPDGVLDSGKLDNAGDVVTLLSADGQVLDEVEYGDEAPWPAAADGDGPSLERIALDGPAGDPDNWAAAIGTAGHSARQLNGVARDDLPRVEAPTIEPAAPVGGESLTVTLAADADAVSLVYRVGFDEERSVEMSAAEPGAATEGGVALWTATVPGQVPGSLIRYRVEAVVGGEVATSPAAFDTIRYHGVVVGALDPDVVQLFISDDDYTALHTDHRLDDVEVAAVLSVGGRVYDNVAIRIRGGDFARVNYPKQSYKITLPAGHLVEAPGLFDEPVDEFGLLADYWDRSFGRTALSWELSGEAGYPKIAATPVRVDRNGTFDGIYVLMEWPDGRWRDRHGLGGQEFYKADDGALLSTDSIEHRWSPREAGGPSLDALAELTSWVLADPSDERTDWLYDHVDIPDLVNYSAFVALIGAVDIEHHNFYLYRDPDTGGRWRILPWDLNTTWGHVCCEVREDFVSPGDASNPTPNPLLRALLEDPDFRAMHFRRLRTLADELLDPDALEARWRALRAPIESYIELEQARWYPESDRTTEEDENAWFTGELADRARVVLEAHRLAGEVPEAQQDAPWVVLGEMLYAPSDGGELEYVELWNPSDVDAVDLSGWRLEGVDAELPPGAVLPPGGRGVVAADGAAFQSVHAAGQLLLGTYPDAISDDGEAIRLVDPAGRVADEVWFSPTEPWPEVAADGRSIVRLDPSVEGNNPAGWTASAAPGGTPGRGEAPAGPGTTIAIRVGGGTGREHFELQIDQRTVAGWTVGPDGVDPDWLEFVVHLRRPVSPGQVRVAFTNDVHDGGGDSNLRVDAIRIGELWYQIEDPTVASSGSWNEATLCEPGFKRQEWLNCAGWFQLDDATPASTSPPDPLPLPPELDGDG